MPGFWDDPELKKAAEQGEYAKFNDVGDAVSGVIAKLSKRDFDGRPAIEVEFEDGTKVTFGQVLMMRELYAIQPTPGDHIEVTLVEVSKKGAKTTKLFKGEVTRKDGTTERFDHTSKTPVS